jgi:hypothetical protein
MARKIAGGFGQQAAFVLALACLLMSVMPAPRAEDLAAPPMVPPMSPPCDVPGMDIAAPATLPNVTAALQKGAVRSTIRWLKENRIDVVLVGVQYTVRLARDANYAA